MKAPRRPWLVPYGIVLLVACSNPPTGELPADLVVVQGPPTAGAPGWVLLDTLKVRLVDEVGNPRPGATLTWVVTKGQGSVAEIGATTDADGMSGALWTLGARSGLNELRISTLDDAFVTFQTVGEAFRVERLASGWDIGCGIVAGAIWCWGRGFWANTPPVSDRDNFGWVGSSPGLVDATRGFIDLAVGLSSVCGLDDQGEMWCASQNAQQMAPISGLPSIRRFVGAGFSFPDQYCGLAVSDSTAWCWQTGGAFAQVPGSPAFADLWMGDDVSGAGLTACGLRRIRRRLVGVRVRWATAPPARLTLLCR